MRQLAPNASLSCIHPACLHKLSEAAADQSPLFCVRAISLAERTVEEAPPPPHGPDKATDPLEWHDRVARNPECDAGRAA